MYCVDVLIKQPTTVSWMSSLYTPEEVIYNSEPSKRNGRQYIQRLLLVVHGLDCKILRRGLFENVCALIISYSSVAPQADTSQARPTGYCRASGMEASDSACTMIPIAM